MENTKLWYINSNHIFCDLPEKDKSEMASLMTPKRINRKGFVFNKGDWANALYILKEGRIKITYIAKDGRELTIDILEPGDIFGELTMAEDEERRTSAEAIEDSLICTISTEAFEAFLSMKPHISLTITKWMGSRLRKIENRFEKLIFQDVPTRLTSLLNDLADKYGEEVEEGLKITIKLSHQEMANLIGAARETVTLEINNMKRRGKIMVKERSYIMPSQRGV